MSVKQTNTITEKLAKLNESVAWFEGEEFDLEKALEKFNEAEVLASEIEKDLTELKNEITVLKKKFDKD